MRAIVVIGAMLVAAGAAGADRARAACIQALIVQERLMVGHWERPAPDGPSPAGRVAAVQPACNDAGQADPDVRIGATRLRGVPPRVAVLHQETLYVAQGTVPQVRGHVLRGAFRRSPGLPRRRRCRPDPTPLRGEARYAGGNVALTLTAGGREREVVVDGSARIAGGPPGQPILVEQRLAIHTSVCGRHRFADRIALLEPVLESERIVPDFDGEPAHDPGVDGAILLAAAGFGIAALRLGGAALLRSRG